MKKSKYNLLYFTFILSVHLGLHSQSNDSIVRNQKNNSIIIGSNFIYNYFTNKAMVEMFVPYGKIPNSNQFVYYWNYKYYDTYTFDVNFQYNKFISNRLSFSGGIRYNQQKSFRKTFLYIDSMPLVPDFENETIKYNCISLPVTLNYYFKRFKFSGGLFLYMFIVNETIIGYDDGSNKKYTSLGAGLMPVFQESVSYKLIKDKPIYVQIGAFQRKDFLDDLGYHNFFTLGLNYELALKPKKE